MSAMTDEQADALLCALQSAGVDETNARRVFSQPLASRLALARALVLGWAVVPREPTEKMCSMGADELPTPTCEATDEEAAAEIYRAMLAAADEPHP